MLSKEREHLVCKLNKSLYGLKKSPSLWNCTLTEFLKTSSFKQSETDLCVCIQESDDVLNIVAVYEYDLIIALRSEEELERIKMSLTSSIQNERTWRVTLLHWNLSEARSQREYYQYSPEALYPKDTQEIHSPICQDCRDSS